MRPPDLPGGNCAENSELRYWSPQVASMRPPDLPGGNTLGVIDPVVGVVACELQ